MTTYDRILQTSIITTPSDHNIVYSTNYEDERGHRPGIVRIPNTPHAPGLRRLGY